MKIKLTVEEAIILVKRALNLPADTEIVITRKAAPPSSLSNCLKEIEEMDYRSSEKISAIKRLRESCPSGLAEAKWAVENWKTFSTFCRKNRRWPVFGGQYNNFTLQ